jgi:putative alpha-1,2-mannosidase
MVDPSHNGANQYTAYNTKKSAWHPYYFKTDMLAYGTEAGFSNVEMTSTSHGSIIHYNFPKHDPNVDFDQTRKIMVTLNGGKDYSELATLEDGTLAIKGYSKDNSGGVQSNFAHHFVIGLYFGADANIPVTSYLAANATSSSAWIEFDARDASTQDITLRVATSLISADQALVNLNREVNTDLTFQDIMSASKSEWSSVLQRVDVESPAHGWSEADQDVLTTFYSALYRMSIFPRQLSEVNADGELVHWSAYDPSGGVFEGPITSDSGFWDAYSTVCK